VARHIVADIHVMSGAAWVGGVFLLMGFIVPSARRFGPGLGGSYLNRFLDHRWFSIYITAVEGLAVLTGFVLFWNASAGLQTLWLTSPNGLAFSVGGAAATVALGISFPISATLSSVYYLAADVNSETNDNPAQAAAFKQQHARLARLGAAYMALLTVAVAGMASAQYLN
jgi:hypothetical protein